MYGFAAALYGNGKQDLAYFLDGADVETIECETGVTQGCGLGTLLFALAFHECIIAELEVDQAKELPEREFKDVMICAYADDAAITGPSTQILAFAERLAQRLDASVLFQIAYTTSVVVRMVGIDGRALARDYSLRPVLG